jgi:hypothetical protein
VTFKEGTVDLTTLLFVLLVLAVLFGGWGAFGGRGSRRRWSYYRWSPALLIVAVVLVLVVTGHLSLTLG